MSVQHRYALVRWFLLAGVLAVAVKSAADLIGHPKVVTTAGGEALIYLMLFVLALLLYGGFALFHTRAATPNEQSSLRQGALWGLVCGSVWVVEVLVANVIGPQLGPFNLICYYGSALTAYLLPGLAALLAARQTGQISAGLRAGLLAGMCGSLILFLAAAFPLFSLLGGNSQPDAQTIREFHWSGLPDLQTFLVGDWLAAMIAHLWIGLVTGFFLGGVGGALGKALALPTSGAAEEPVLKG
jgi:hypothetical protein